MSRLLRLPQVVERTGLSETTIWRWEKAGKFPRRRRLGPNSVAWVADELEEWAAALPVVELGDESGSES